MSDLPLTKKVAELLNEGKVEEAKRLHNATLRDRFAAAERGAIINLSDLMASREEFEMPRKKRVTGD